ncbi:MAG: TldD/PmbA family protein, partial [Akkermansiaceae bacterium]|nr:TldD/PmbA family protein [Akkermansiaceae bacterium]
IQRSHRGLDLVGIFAAGDQYSGFADERGQFNWHEVSSHHLDWSVHGEGGRAAKASYAGFDFEDQVLAERAEDMRESLSALAAGTKTLEPGEYPVFLSPSAMDELFSLLSWGGFSARAQHTRTTPLLKLVEGHTQLSDELAIGENTRDGLSPDFDGLGFRRPAVVPLVAAGRHAGALVSPRSAAEFDLEANGANAYESP